jgi:DNA-binding response OmpR family regulator
MLQLLLAEENYDVHTAATMEQRGKWPSSIRLICTFWTSVCRTARAWSCAKSWSQLSPGVPCIFYTGDAYEIHRREAMEAGAAAYVAKPNIEGLIAAVHELLANSECATAAD